MYPRHAAQVIRDNRLTREMVPTHLLAHPVVWEALLEEMPLTALIRNLATMTRVGLVASGSRASHKVAERLRAAGLRQVVVVDLTKRELGIPVAWVNRKGEVGPVSLPVTTAAN